MIRGITALVAVAAAMTFVASAAASVRLISPTSPVAAGGSATLTAGVLPRTVSCTITVSYKSGPSQASGLTPERPSLAGRVSWTWKVGTSTTTGRWPIVVACGPAGTMTTFLEVTGSTSTAGSTTGKSSGKVDVGRTVLLAPRTKASGCKLGPDPDPRCSPGALYSKLTKAVLCSSGFRTGSVRNVPQSEKFAVEREYGMPAGLYGATMEIDHIVSLEIGGSNDIANLFPEKAKPSPGYPEKDKLENRLHAMVCANQMTLRAAQQQIAANWQALYKKVFGVPPLG
jgi:hypothetical protein